MMDKPETTQRKKARVSGQGQAFVAASMKMMATSINIQKMMKVIVVNI